MSELDASIREQLAPLLPLPPGRAPDWNAVVRRATPLRRRRRAVLAAAATLMLLVTAAVAVAGAVFGFSPWLSGQPGAAVSPSEQQAFEDANLRTWDAFAPGTELRKLLSTSLSGTTFTLFGFRSGDDLCLKLELAGSVTGGATRCAPEHDLQAADQPAVVVSADEPFGSTGPAGADGYTLDAYQATFGMASDGVTRVTVDGDDGAHDALLGGNAFLYVDDHPSHGARVRSVSAESGSGERVALDFEGSPYGMFDMPPPPAGTFHGPSKAQRTVTGGTIGWLVRGEQPGEPVPPKLADTVARLAVNPPWGFVANRWPQAPMHVITERLLQPDPNDFIRMVVAGVSPSGSMADPGAGVCIGVLEGGGVGSSCQQLSQEFARGPLWLTIGGSGMSQYAVLSGVASDDVARIAAYLGNGDVAPVALRDNVFLARIARGQFPLRVVAYDAQGLVVYVQDFASDGMTSPAPAAARTSVAQVARLVGPHGGIATLRAGTLAGGYRCWSIDLAGGESEGGCTPWPPQDDGLKTVGVMNTKGDSFLAGEVPASIASIRATYPDGATQTIDTHDGLVLAGVPAETGVFQLHGLDASGKEVTARGLKVSR